MANPISSSQGSGSLRRILGVTFGVAVTVGGTIGVGILRTPGTVAMRLGTEWLVVAVWVAGGLYALLGTNAVVELGTAVPRAGGWYVWSRRAFGEYVGFTVGWSDWLSQCATIAVLAIATGEFLAAFLPRRPGLEQWTAVTTVLTFAGIQWIGLRSSSRTQEVTSALKAIGLLAFVAACYFPVSSAMPESQSRQPLNLSAGTLFASVILALQSVIYTYDGWYCAIYFTEEDQNPGRNLPRAAFGGVLSTLAIYLLVNSALMHALPLDQLASSSFPAADVAHNLFGSKGEQIITALAALSLLSIINATLMMSTRILFAMSRDRLFLGRAATVSEGGTPRFAMVLTTAAALAMIVTGTFDFLIAVAAFLFIAVDASGFLALLALRRREPHLARPYRTRGHPWTTVLLVCVCLVFLTGNILSDAAGSLYTLGLIAVSYPVYLFVRRRIHTG